MVSNRGMVLRAVIVLLFGLVSAYQLRSSLDTIHVSRHLDLYLPFTLAPFTARVDSLNYLPRQDDETRLKRGDEIVTVNGRPFTGLSVLMQELLPQRQGVEPLVLGVRDGNGTLRTLQIYRPHCTCGAPALWEAITVYAIAPMFCVLLGFALVWRSPNSIRSWMMLALLLALSQLTLFPTLQPGFQLISNDMTWTGWFRVPAVGYQALAQSIWPAALLGLMAASWRVSAASIGLFGIFAGFAVVRAILAVAWSEQYRTLAWLHNRIDPNQTELIVLAFAATALLAYTWWTRLGLAWTVVATGVMIALYWDPPGVQVYSETSLYFIESGADLHLTPRFVILVAAACLVLTYLVFAPLKHRVRALAGFAFCIPLAAHVGGIYGNFWWLLGPQRGDRAWPLFVLAATACGLLILASWIRQEDSSDATGAAALEISAGG